MKKSYRAYIISTISTIALVVLLLIIVKFQMLSLTWVPTMKENEYWFFSILGSFGSMLASLAAAINLIVIVRFYIADKNYKSIEQKTQCKIYWYRTVILEKNMSVIDSYFKKSIDIIHECEKINIDKRDELVVSDFNKAIKIQLGYYVDEKMNINYNLTDMIRIINDEFGQKLDNVVMDFQDEFSELIVATSMQDKFDALKLEKKVFEQKKKFLNMLYDFEINILYSSNLVK
jgi:hypothetical protein